MGSGIAQVFAQAGFTVRLVDTAQPALDRARTTIETSLTKLAEKGKTTLAERSAALERLSMATSLDTLSGADYVIEAIVEDAPAKRALFSTLDTFVRPGVILASNTSSISIASLAAMTNRPDEVPRDALHEPGPADGPGRTGPRQGDIG